MFSISTGRGGMDLFKLFDVEAAIEQYAQEAQKRRRSLRQMQKHRSAPKLHAQLFGMVEMEWLYSSLPDGELYNRLLVCLEHEAICHMENVLLRPNRELVELHAVENHCHRCTNKLSCCTCKEHVLIEDRVVQQHIYQAIQHLHYSGRLMVVYLDTSGALTTQDARSILPVYKLW